MQFEGSFVPLITPFTQKGLLDKKRLEKLIAWHVEAKTDSLIVAATTGESLSLSDKEYRQVIEIAVKNSSIPIIASTGTSDTNTSIKKTKTALALGAQGALVVTPYYNKPNIQGCIAHYSLIATLGLPIILYHNPSRTAVCWSKEEIKKLIQIPNIVAIKESSHNLQLVKEIAPHIPLFCGDDDLTVEMMQEGAVGSISATANVIPKEWKELLNFCKKGKWEEAKALFQMLLPLISSLFLETNPQGVKYALSKMDRCLNILRLPLISVQTKTQVAIDQTLMCLKKSVK